MPFEVSRLGEGTDLVGESPVWDDGTGQLYWVDIVGKAIRRWDRATGKFETRVVDGCPSAVALRSAGGLSATIDNDFGRFDFESGIFHPEFAVETDPQMRLNEGKTDPAGRFWTASMENNLHPDGTPHQQTAQSGRLFCIDDGEVRGPFCDGLGIPNTMAWSPSGDRFYFGDSARNVIWSFDYEPQTGGLSNRRVFVEGGPGVPDGSAMDAHGFLWTARFGAACLTRYAPDGRVDQIIDLPATNPTSCCFGDSPDEIFITTARFDLDHPGDFDGALLVLRLR